MRSPILEVGRRLYSGTALLTLAVAALNTYAMTLPVPPDYDLAAQAMRNSTMDMGMGMRPSLWDVHMAFAFTMSIALAMMGALGLVLASTADSTSRVLDRSATVFAVTSGALTALYWVTKVPPPFITMAVLTLCWGLSMRTTRLA